MVHPKDEISVIINSPC